jgi:hypothetical protein
MCKRLPSSSESTWRQEKKRVYRVFSFFLIGRSEHFLVTLVAQRIISCARR